jgi:hypothetical protein
MLNYNTELENIFNNDCSIPSSREDILSCNTVLYGAGSLGTMAVDLMNKKGLNPQYVIDKSRNGTVGDVKIVKPEKIILNDKENFLFLICISTLPYNDIATYLKALGCRHFMHFYTWAYLIMPELLENGWFKAGITESDKKEILSVCKALAHNELSPAHYIQFLWWKLRLKEIIYEGYPVLTGEKYFKSPVFPVLGEHEALLDGGVHFGQTIEAFIEKTKNN